MYVCFIYIYHIYINILKVTKKFLSKEILNSCHTYMGSPCSSVVKEFACNSGELGSSPGSGRSPGKGNGNPFQYSSLENPMDRAWQATVHAVARIRHNLATKPPPPPYRHTLK